MSNAQLVSFWEGSVTWLERLCVASMLQHSHPLAIYTYDPDALAKYNLGAEIRDAREVITETDFAYQFRIGGRFAIFSDLFRLNLLRESKGIWVDLDCYMIKPLVPKSDYVFGWTSPTRINNAVLGAPADCAMIDEYTRAG